MEKAAIEGSKNTKRDLEGSKHEVEIPRESCKVLRVSPIFSMMLVHCGLKNKSILNWEKE